MIVTTKRVRVEPSQEMKTNPASSVPAIAPTAPEANIAPSAGPVRSAEVTAI